LFFSSGVNHTYALVVRVFVRVIGSLFQTAYPQKFYIASQSKSVENEHSSGVSSETPLDMACSL
jgi:hypothetical protein